MAKDRTITGKGFQVIFKTGTAMKLVENAIREGLDIAANRYLAAVKENVSLDDHSLADLRALGSPYGTSSSGQAHDDDRLVHTQSGELKAGMHVTPATRQSDTSIAAHVLSEASYTDFLLNGTSKMRPRRFDEKAYEDVGGQAVFDPLRNMLAKLHYKIEGR